MAAASPLACPNERLARARALDAADPLAWARARFRLPEGIVYLDGNSLGALPAATPGRIAGLIGAEWGDDLVTSWNAHDWIGMPGRVGDAIAPLIGARPGEVVATDTTSTNLFKLLCGALSLRPGRRTILSEPGNFPTDLYVAEGVAGLGIAELRLAEREGIAAAIDEDVAVVMLTHVHYKSAAMFDMAAIAAAAHAAGALMLWDLSHSTGAVEVDLNGTGADLAVGCGYKYLNGGPGAPAFLFVAGRHQAAIASPLSGWMGHAAPFAFADGYAPAPGIARMLCGTPPILGLAALAEGVRVVAECGVQALAAKGRLLSEAFVAAALAEGAEHGLALASPADPAARGAHVSFRHPEAYALCQALIAQGVIGDFRTPDLVRFGFAAAYLRHEEVARAAATLGTILRERSWDRAEFRQRAAVT